MAVCRLCNTIFYLCGYLPLYHNNGEEGNLDTWFKNKNKNTVLIFFIWCTLKKLNAGAVYSELEYKNLYGWIIPTAVSRIWQNKNKLALQLCSLLYLVSIMAKKAGPKPNTLQLLWVFFLTLSKHLSNTSKGRYTTWNRKPNLLLLILNWDFRE